MSDNDSVHNEPTLYDLGNNTTEDESESDDNHGGHDSDNESDNESDKEEVKVDRNARVMSEGDDDDIDVESVEMASGQPKGVRVNRFAKRKRTDATMLMGCVSHPIDVPKPEKNTWRHARPSSADDETDEGHDALVASVLAKYANI